MDMRKSITELVLKYINLYNELLEDDEIEPGDKEWVSKKEELSEERLISPLPSETPAALSLSFFTAPASKLSR